MEGGIQEPEKLSGVLGKSLFMDPPYLGPFSGFPILCFVSAFLGVGPMQLGLV